ncbi:MAG: hypothetical protein WDZ37_00435 [Solirubrobacterales bacterium]
MHDQDPGVRERLQKQAEDAIGKLADELLENPLFNSALSGAFAAREKVAQAQQQAMGALNLPSASDLEKLERRIRSISHRLDEVEDTVERLLDKLESLNSKLDVGAKTSAKSTVSSES